MSAITHAQDRNLAHFFSRTPLPPMTPARDPMAIAASRPIIPMTPSGSRTGHSTSPPEPITPCPTRATPSADYSIGSAASALQTPASITKRPRSPAPEMGKKKQKMYGINPPTSDVKIKITGITMQNIISRLAAHYNNVLAGCPYEYLTNREPTTNHSELYYCPGLMGSGSHFMDFREIFTKISLPTGLCYGCIHPHDELLGTGRQGSPFGHSCEKSQLRDWSLGICYYVFRNPRVREIVFSSFESPLDIETFASYEDYAHFILSSSFVQDRKLTNMLFVVLAYFTAREKGRLPTEPFGFDNEDIGEFGWT